MGAHLLLRLDAPLMSFGGDQVDAHGVVRDFPAYAAITGLIANALGWERHDVGRHDRLQRRLVMGSVRLREGYRIRDFQTAQLEAGDRGWTTTGSFEGRAGGGRTYESPHIRYRDADVDALVAAALRFEPAKESPELDAVAAALDRPERPLFIGRKPFLPATPLCLGSIDAPNIKAALERAAGSIDLGNRDAQLRAQWPVGEGGGGRLTELTDGRNWLTGVHAGLRQAIEGRISASGS